MLLITVGPNAISVSLSPCNHYILVGLAAKRFTWIFTPKQVRSLTVLASTLYWQVWTLCGSGVNEKNSSQSLGGTFHLASNAIAYYVHNYIISYYISMLFQLVWLADQSSLNLIFLISLYCETSAAENWSPFTNIAYQNFDLGEPLAAIECCTNFLYILTIKILFRSVWVAFAMSRKDTWSSNRGERNWLQTANLVLPEISC